MDKHDPERKRTLAQYRIKIDGQDAPKRLADAVIDVMVDERLHRPAMFEIRILVDFINPDATWLDDPLLQEGKEVNIRAGYRGDEQPIFTGKITSIEADLDQAMPTMTVRGYDHSFKMHRGVKTRAFLKMTDSDIASKIAGESGLTPQIDTTSGVHEYVVQHAQTNYEFLLRRARRIGFEMLVDGQKLVFRKPVPGQSAAPRLTWAEHLHAFQPRLSVAEQVKEVEVRSWDVKEKKAISGKATNGKAPSKTGISKTGGAAATAVWGEASRVIVDTPTEDQSEATKIAQAILDDVTSSYIQATGECEGDQNIRVGKTVTIQGVGKRFNGDYYLTATRHIIDKKKGYRVTFTASTRDPETVGSLLAETEQRPLAPHTVVGVVTNNKDPEELGRVKVKFPWFDDTMESHWARLVSPMTGNDRGLFMIPEVDDEVLIAFEHGDPNRPFVVGSLWNGKDKTPKKAADAVGGDSKVNLRIWKSRSGHVFVFDDTAGEEQIQIIDKTTKNHIVITSKDNKLDVLLEGDVVVTSKTGNINMTAEQGNISIEAKQGKISMTAQQDFSVESKTAKLSMAAQQDVSLESKTATLKMMALQDVGLKSSSAKVDVSAAMDATFQSQTGKAAMKGITADVQAQTAAKLAGMVSAEVSGTASAKVSGAAVQVQGTATVDIQGSAMVGITGALVKLN